MNGPGKEEECLGKASGYLGKEMRGKGRKEDCRGGACPRGQWLDRLVESAKCRTGRLGTRGPGGGHKVGRSSSHIRVRGHLVPQRQ